MRVRLVLLLSVACALASCRDHAEFSAVVPAPTVPPDCAGLSPLGRAIYEAAVNAAEPSTIPPERILTYENRAGRSLVDGEAIFTGLADLIVEATRSVDVAMFDWEVESDASDVLIEALHALERRHLGRQAGPIAVRIVVNAFIGQPASTNAIPLAKRIVEERLDPSVLDIRIASRTALAFGVMHQKLAIIDEAIVHIGGANVQAFHDWKDGALPWHDSAYVLEGAVAWSVLADFDAMWVEGKTWQCDDRGCSGFDNAAISRGAWHNTVEGLCTPMIALSRRADGFPNNRIDNPQNAGYLAAMDDAEHVIKIFTPNLNDDAVKDGIVRAIARGVQVQVIVSKGFNGRAQSLPGQGGDNQHNAEELYSAAVANFGRAEACRRLQMRWYVQEGLGVIDGNGPGASHLKYMSIDEQVAIVGSANMDTQAWNQSAEVNIAIDDAATTTRLDAHVFDGDFSAATPVSACANYLLWESGAVESGAFAHHHVRLAAGQSVIVKASGERDVDLYLSVDRTPHRSDYDAMSDRAGDDLLAFVMPTAGTLRIGVYGWEASDYVLTVESNYP